MVQILARMQLETVVDPLLLEFSQDRQPAPTELRERLIDGSGWPGRPRREVGPCETPGESPPRQARRSVERRRTGSEFRRKDRWPFDGDQDEGLLRLAFARSLVPGTRHGPVEPRTTSSVVRTRLCGRTSRVSIISSSELIASVPSSIFG